LGTPALKHPGYIQASLAGTQMRACVLGTPALKHPGYIQASLAGTQMGVCVWMVDWLMRGRGSVRRTPDNSLVLQRQVYDGIPLFSASR
jgi:hypothetical protein